MAGTEWKSQALSSLRTSLSRFVQQVSACDQQHPVPGTTELGWGAGRRAVSVSRLLFKVLREAQLVEAETFLHLGALLLHL